MDAIAKSLAGKETGTTASPDGMPLDEYVQAAWSSVVAKAEAKANAGGRAAETTSKHAAFAADFPETEMLPLPMRLQALRDMPVTAAESATEQTISPRALRSKDQQRDNMQDNTQDNTPLTGFVPQPVLPLRPADLSWQPQRGVAAPTTSNTIATAVPNTSTASSTSTASAGSTGVTTSVTTSVTTAAAVIAPVSAPIATKKTITAAIPAASQSPVTAPIPQTVMPVTPNKSSTASKSSAAIQSAILTVAKKDMPLMAGQSAEKTAGMVSTQIEDVTSTMPTPIKEALPLKKKPSTHKENPSSAIAEAPLQLNAAQPLQTPAQLPALQENTTERPAQSKQPAQGAPMAADVKMAGAVSNGSSLTYRFDKWNGNHAVTVHTAAPADLSQTAGRGDIQAGAQTPTTSLPESPAGLQQTQHTQYTQQPLQSTTQYTLSPSDQLVGQRLGEHLARFGFDADMPQLHLKDADQRQQQQQQAEQQDEEDEA